MPLKCKKGLIVVSFINIFAVSTIIVFVLNNLWHKDIGVKRLDYDSLRIPIKTPRLKKKFICGNKNKPKTHTILRTFAKTCLPNTVILDIGCNVGSTTFKMTEVIPQDVKVVAIDQNRENIEFVDKIISMNKELQLYKIINTIHAMVSKKEKVINKKAPVLTRNQVLGGRTPSLIHILHIRRVEIHPKY